MADERSSVQANEVLRRLIEAERAARERVDGARREGERRIAEAHDRAEKRVAAAREQAEKEAQQIVGEAERGDGGRGSRTGRRAANEEEATDPERLRRRAAEHADEAAGALVKWVVSGEDNA